MITPVNSPAPSHSPSASEAESDEPSREYPPVGGLRSRRASASSPSSATEGGGLPRSPVPLRAGPPAPARSAFLDLVLNPEAEAEAEATSRHKRTLSEMSAGYATERAQPRKRDAESTSSEDEMPTGQSREPDRAL